MISCSICRHGNSAGADVGPWRCRPQPVFIAGGRPQVQCYINMYDELCQQRHAGINCLLYTWKLAADVCRPGPRGREMQVVEGPPYKADCALHTSALSLQKPLVCMQGVGGTGGPGACAGRSAPQPARSIRAVRGPQRGACHGPGARRAAGSGIPLWRQLMEAAVTGAADVNWRRTEGLKPSTSEAKAGTTRLEQLGSVVRAWFENRLHHLQNKHDNQH